MDIKIRKANIADTKEIVAININSWIDTYTNIFPNEFLNSLDSKRETAINNCISKIDEYHVALINNKVVGFIRYGLNKKDFSNDYAEVYSLYIDSSNRRKGIGKKLLIYSFDNLKKKYKYCLISTLVENKANKFYQKNGGEIIRNSEFSLLDKIYNENVYLFILKNY